MLIENSSPIDEEEGYLGWERIRARPNELIRLMVDRRFRAQLERK